MFKKIRVLSIVLPLLSVHYCFAAGPIIYVNINNPTPGNGSTWSAAFNDLNAALLLSTGSNQIWVAQGVYKPTATTNRAATFYITGGCNIYGGFNGTETALTQRNITANLTVLSGDIGIPTDNTDNSYNIVTFENIDGTYNLDGFTIRDGNANAGYPGSTAPQPNNMGGGVLILAQPGELSYGSILNCSFLNNFAVYGGGFCAYGYGANSESFYFVGDSRFDNNTAVTGGAAASAAYTGDAGNGDFQNCIFTNNTSTGTQGSVIAALVNTPGQDMMTTIYNCVFYNDAAPQLYNQQTGGNSYLQCYNTIIWTSGAPYAGPLIIGPNTLIDDCDLDLATPSSNNLDIDPEFVNPAGGDFHVAHCSPVIDAGDFPTGQLSTDLDGNPRTLGYNRDMGVYETALPPYPAVTNLTYCQYATAAPLTATPLAGYTLNWYYSSTGGTGSPTAPIPSTTVASPFPQTYYVSQIDPLGCEGHRYPIKVTVNSGAAEPAATAPIPYCQNTAAVALTATGTNLLWYTTATGGTGSPTAPIPSTALVGSIPYYVTQTPAGSCESQRLEVDVTTMATDAAPAATSPLPYCQNTTAAALTATGANLLWYTAATGGTGTSTAPIPSTTNSGNTTWYVSETTAGACESPRTPVTVTITGQSTEPTAVPVTYCQNTTAAALTATGADLLWYTAATGGTGTSTAPIPSTTNSGNTTYYVSQTITGTCESPRTPVTVTVGSQSTSPTAAPVSYCQNTTAAALTATGTNLLWYTAATGGTGTTTAPTPSTTSTGNTTWYVTQTSTGTCESPRSEVSVTVYALPNVSIDPVATTFCPGSSVTLEASGASTYQWSPVTDLSDPAISDPVALIHDNIEYIVTGTDVNGCTATAQVSLKSGCNNSNSLEYSVPNAFTPNGDGRNDVFRAKSTDTPKSFSMVVFNRYGQKVFESEDISVGWSGASGGILAPSGAYVYIVMITTSAGSIVKKQGTVILIR